MVPTATYRLQLHGAFTFDDAREIAPYLRELGISHVYSSPYLQATEGSTHGYDVVDHNAVNEELGGVEGHQALQIELGRVGLGQVLDIVPNHMAIGTRANRWWWDVLENGPSSRFAEHFDVEWNPPEARLTNLVLVPVLGDHFGRVLEAGELKLQREGGKFHVKYHAHEFPVAPKTLPLILKRACSRMESDELAFISDAFNGLPDATETDAARILRRHRDKEILSRQLADLCSGDPHIAEAVDHALAEINHDPDLLDEILSNQNYRLAFWRTAGRELGYRRFFDINTLAGLRMQRERVFKDTHRLILEWLRRGVLDGVRIDHPDGLRDPEEYFRRLRKAAPKAWVVAEKILEPGEKLRESWDVAGTTGYDFIFRAGSLFVDPAGDEPLTRIYTEFTGNSADYHALIRERKHQVLRGTLGSDVNNLTQMFLAVCERHRRYRDFVRHEIHHALRELVACFPVYRTYVRDGGGVHPDDRRHIETAIVCAKNSRPDLPPDLFDFLQSVLLAEEAGESEGEFVARFQQFTGPAMAKGVEDTAFYVFNRLSSLNEVGGDPSCFGVSVDEFHRLTAESQANWPTAMLATSTHDTKRSEDVRCRLHLLSEIPDEWGEAVRRWSAHNEKHRNGDMPDRNMEYLFYQALVGAWPIDADRTANYMEKASREAKTFTSWTDPNRPYDEALQSFVRRALDDREFLDDVAAFASRLIEPGRINSLALTLLKLTAPGVPDIYQGTEIWDLSLVDPDNRRPVDYEHRQRLLREAKGMGAEQVLARMDDGISKIWLIHKTLGLRRSHEAWFNPGTYEPLYATGEKADHVVAFMRGGGAITVVPRLPIRLGGLWKQTVLHVPEGQWTNVLTEERIQAGDQPVTQIFGRFPLALLRRG